MKEFIAKRSGHSHREKNIAREAGAGRELTLRFSYENACKFVVTKSVLGRSPATERNRERGVLPKVRLHWRTSAIHQHLDSCFFRVQRRQRRTSKCSTFHTSARRRQQREEASRIEAQMISDRVSHLAHDKHKNAKEERI